jgi:hypothetical protein
MCLGQARSWADLDPVNALDAARHTCPALAGFLALGLTPMSATNYSRRWPCQRPFTSIGHLSWKMAPDERGPSSGNHGCGCVRSRYTRTIVETQSEQQGLKVQDKSSIPSFFHVHPTRAYSRHVKIQESLYVCSSSEIGPTGLQYR